MSNYSFKLLELNNMVQVILESNRCIYSTTAYERYNNVTRVKYSLTFFTALDFLGFRIANDLFELKILSPTRGLHMFSNVL